jgi:hypothetical protein
LADWYDGCRVGQGAAGIVESVGEGVDSVDTLIGWVTTLIGDPRVGSMPGTRAAVSTKRTFV